MNVLSVVCALLFSMLECNWYAWKILKVKPLSWILNSVSEVWREGWRFFFGHLLAEIFGAISLCSFWKGRLKENHLSAVTGRGVDRRYTIVYGNLEKPWKHRNWLLHNWRHCLKKMNKQVSFLQCLPVNFNGWKNAKPLQFSYFIPFVGFLSNSNGDT